MCSARLHKQALPEVLPVAPQVDYRLPPYDADAFLIEAELLPDWYLPLQPRRHRARRARHVPLALARGAAAGARSAEDLGAARLPFAEPAVAAGAARHRLRRPARFPGCGARAGGLRPCIAASGRARRCAGGDGDRAGRPLRARAPDRRSGVRRRRSSRVSTRHWPRSAPRRSSASLRGSTGATASRNTCATCRGSTPTCSARLPTRASCGCATGTSAMSRHLTPRNGP